MTLSCSHESAVLLSNKKIPVPHRASLLFFLSAIFLVALIMQMQLPINQDVAWLLEASRRLANGGTYTHDFFENNPPLILYLYSPVIWVQHFFPIGFVMALRGYVLLLSAMSLGLSWLLLKKFLPLTTLSARFTLLTFAGLMLVFPGHDFGQREHLLVILTLPYLFLLVVRLSGYEVNVKLACLIGALAALGFGLKPYFLVTWFSIEIYYFMYQSRRILAWVRPEVLTLGFVLSAYLFLVYLRHADYLNWVMPYALKWCYSSSRVQFFLLVLHGTFLYSFLVYCAGWLINRDDPLFHLLRIMALAGMGFLIAHLIQQTLSSYHMYPPLFYAVFISCVYFAAAIQAPSTLLKPFTRWLFLLSLFVLLIFIFKPLTNTILLFTPNNYFSFFFFLPFLICCLTCRSLPNFFIRLLAILFILGLAYYLSIMCRSTSFQTYTFSFTTLFLFLSMSLCIPRIRGKRFNAVLILAQGFLFFSLPFFQSSLLYFSFTDDTTRLNQFVHFLREDAKGHSVANLSTELFFQYLLDSDTTYVSNYSFLWMLPGLVKESAPSSERLFLAKQLVANLNEKKPDYVLVDVSQEKNQLTYYSLKTHRVEKIPFDFLAYFLIYPEFKTAWKPYVYVKTLRDQQFFNDHVFQVYQRKSP